jgi:hypothetical protein
VKRTVIVLTLCMMGLISLPLNGQTNPPSGINQQLVLEKLSNIEARLLVVSDMMNYIIIMAVIFASMTGLTIGFALWDRRTMIRPFESKVKEIETTINKTQERLDKAQKIDEEMISALREYAKKDRKFAEIIKGFNIF